MQTMVTCEAIIISLVVLIIYGSLVSHTVEPVSAASHTVEQVSAVSHTVEPVSAVNHTVEPVSAASHTVEPVSAVNHTVEPVSAVTRIDETRAGATSTPGTGVITSERAARTQHMVNFPTQPPGDTWPVTLTSPTIPEATQVMSPTHQVTGATIYYVREDANKDRLEVNLERLFNGTKWYETRSHSNSSLSLTKYQGNLVAGESVCVLKRNGDLFLTRQLDYDTGDRQFGLLVVAEGPDGTHDSVDIELRVINVNDNPPVFVNTGCLTKCSDPQYFVEVKGNFIGPVKEYRAGPVIAYDLDGDEVEYRLTEGSPTNFYEFLEIDKDTGSLTIMKSLDSGSVDYLDVGVQVLSRSTLPGPKKGTTPDTANSAILVFIKVDAPKLATRGNRLTTSPAVVAAAVWMMWVATAATST